MSKSKQKIALTGGIASGKSTVLSCFSKRGLLVFSADEIYNSLLDERNFVEEISKTVGVMPIFVDNKLCIDRKNISKVVFSNKAKLDALNAVTHKRVYEKIERIHNESDAKSIIFEIPLLFESGKQNDFDIVFVVTRTLNSRIKAIMSRDGIDEESAILRIKNQVDYDKKLPYAHTVIHNDGSLDELLCEVDAIIEKFQIKR